jgi:excisionase family DNA binding protein
MVFYLWWQSEIFKTNPMEENFTHLQAFIQGIIKDAVETALEQNHQHQTGVEQFRQESGKENEILNVDQAAMFLHIAKQTLYTLTCKRRIPFYKNGKKILFKRHELQEWMDNGRKSPMDQTSPKISSSCRHRRFR